MVSVRASLQQAKQIGQELVSEARDFTEAAKEKIINPKRLQKAADGATRTGQVLSLLVLGPFIVVSFTIIKVLNSLMADVLGAGTIASGQTDVITFLVTFLTLGLLVIAAWGWFQYVRTAGFGAFSDD